MKNKRRRMRVIWLVPLLIFLGGVMYGMSRHPAPRHALPTGQADKSAVDFNLADSRLATSNAERPAAQNPAESAALESQPEKTLQQGHSLARISTNRLPASLPAEQIEGPACRYLAKGMLVSLSRAKQTATLVYDGRVDPAMLAHRARAAGFKLLEHDPIYRVMILEIGGATPGDLSNWPGVEYADWLYAEAETLAPVVATPRLIAALRPGQSAETYARQNGLRLVRSLPGLDGVHVFQAPCTTRSIWRWVAELAGDSQVAWMEPDLLTKKRTAYRPNDAHYDRLWHLHGMPFRDRDTNAHIHAEGAWDITRGHSNVVIAVLDDGFYYQHEDLTNRVFINTGEYGGGKESNGIDDDANGYVDDWQGWNFRNHNNYIYGQYHGSAVAGLCVAEGDNAQGICGVAFDSRVLMVILGLDAEFTSYADVAAAIAYAGQFADVINISWGGYNYSLVEEAALNSVTTNGRAGKGCAVICAAGNANSKVAYPAAYDAAVAVGATEHRDWRATYSNKGPQLDVMAPAGDGYAALWTLDIEGGYNVQRGWHGYTNVIAASGVHTLEWVFVNCTSQQFSWRGGAVGEEWDSAWLDDITLPGGAVEGFETGDLSAWPWETGGQTNWAAESFNPFAGSYSARAGDLGRAGSEQYAFLRIVTNLTAGNVTFRYYVSSFFDSVNWYADRLAFVVNGVTQEQFRGESGDTDGQYRDGFNGTSASCPIVAGVAALLYAQYPDLTATEARMALRQCADKVGPETYQVGRNDHYGWGRINSERLLKGPVIVSTPSTVGAVGVPYRYDADQAAEAIGQGTITWGVDRAPAGFEINPASGVITWTPTNRGPHAIAIHAMSSQGTNIQEWVAHIRSDFYVNDTSRVADVYCNAIGAIGNDGLTTNTPQLSIQAIFDMYELGAGDRVFVDTGAYNLTNNINITSNDTGGVEGYLSLLGSPNGSTVDRLSIASGTYCLKIDGAEYLCVSNLNLRRGQYGLWASNSTRSVFSGMNIRDAGRDGVRITNGTHMALSGVDVQGCGHHGIRIVNSLYPSLDHCVVAHNATNGMDIRNPGLCQLANCTLAGNGRNQVYLYASADEDFAPAPLIVSNSIIVAHGANAVGLYLEGSDLYGPFYIGDHNNFYADGGARVGENHGFAATPACYTLEAWGQLNHSDSNSMGHAPLFATTNDFHLASREGRYAAGAWVQDADHSPCIDLGDPRAAFGGEPAPNGGRLNLGAYGGTVQASKSRTNAWVLARSPNQPDPSGTFTGLVNLAWSYGAIAGDEIVELQYSADYGATWSVLQSGLRADAGSWTWDTTSASSTMMGLWRVACPTYGIWDACDRCFIIRNTNAVFVFYVNDSNTVGDIHCTAPGDDANPGSPDAPKATAQAIIDHVDLAPGDTVFMDTGRYPLGQNIKFSDTHLEEWSDDGGDADRHLTLRGAGPGTVLDRVGRLSTNYAVNLYYADWVTIANLTITNGGTGIYIRNTENAMVENVEVDGAVNGIVFYYADNNLVSQCLIHDCSTEGIDCQGSTNIQVRQCTISRNDSQIYARSGSQVDARGCIFNTHQAAVGFYCVEVGVGSSYAGDYNQFTWPTNGYLGYYGSQSATNLAGWIAATGQDSNSLASIAQFRDMPGRNYRLIYGAQAIDRGQNDLAPSNDFEGVQRPIDGDFDGLAVADIGCYEYAPGATDTDGDGMTDKWEWSYELDPTNSADAGWDPDEDRFSNLEEFIAETVPTNSASFFKLEDARAGAEGVVLTWRSATGRVYGLFAASNLDLAADFQPLATNLPATPVLNSYTDAVFNVTPQGFYRINVRQHP